MTTTAHPSETDLTLARNAEIAVTLLAAQGRHGAVSEVARRYEVSRGRVYRATATATEALHAAFERTSGSGDEWVVPAGVDRARLERFVVAARVEGVNSIRAIMRLTEHALSVEPSYRYVRETLEEAYVRAAQFNASVPLEGIKAAATDEMFSQGAPVLGGIDLRSQFVFGLEVSERRDEQAWSGFIEKAKSRGFDPQVIVKDAGTGMAAGISAALPRCEQRDDSFHAMQRMTKQLRRLEQRAYGAIAKLYEAREAYRSGRYRCSSERQYALLCDAQVRCEEEVTCYDHYAAACERGREAMEFFDLRTGHLRSGEDVASGVCAAAAAMRALESAKIDKDVAGYLEGRAAGLGLYADELGARLREAAPRVGGIEVVELGCMLWRHLTLYRQERRSWKQRERVNTLMVVMHSLRERLGVQDADVAIDAIFAIIDERFRASSLIESLNSLLRPYLFVHKSVSQGFLELFVAWRNLRSTTWWGKHKGQSAYEVLTGEKVKDDDWLRKLGYAPSPALQ